MPIVVLAAVVTAHAASYCLHCVRRPSLGREQPSDVFHRQNSSNVFIIKQPGSIFIIRKLPMSAPSNNLPVGGLVGVELVSWLFR